MSHKNTRHHRLPRSRWWNNNYDNICVLKENKHRAFHLLFWNKLPHEQVQEILDINWCALNWEFIVDIETYLNDRALKDMYNRRCYIDKLITN